MGEFEGYDNYYTEDLIIGKLDEKYNFQMAEVKTEEESTDSDGDTHTSIVFYGLFGNIECAKNIGTKFKVRSDKGIFGKMFKGKTKVEMDSQEFEKYFDVTYIAQSGSRRRCLLDTTDEPLDVVWKIIAHIPNQIQIVLFFLFMISNISHTIKTSQCL